MTVFGRIANISYHPAVNFERDVTQYLVGAGWAHAFGSRGTPTVFASGYVAEDADKDPDGARFGRSFLGARAGAQYRLRGDLDVIGSVAVEWSDYGGSDPFFLVNRDDTYIELKAGLHYRPQEGWTLRPELRYARNDSNVPTSDYSRFEALLTVRYDFR